MDGGDGGFVLQFQASHLTVTNEMSIESYVCVAIAKPAYKNSDFLALSSFDSLTIILSGTGF